MRTPNSMRNCRRKIAHNWPEVNTIYAELRAHNDFAVRLSIGQQSDGANAILKRQALTDTRLEFSLDVPLE